ncbi:hypothetical protein [Streptomyces thinghirensis]|uniref:AMP-dependent synthetase/ligase domain-containing protein n=1 Tax=Streptomyces thinghirensis TaxID=551547 RepID=A0ABP9TDR7_9ACTN
MPGYHGRLEETAAPLTDGWLHTGDGRLHEDGYLTLVDRKKDLVIRRYRTSRSRRWRQCSGGFRKRWKPLS